MSRTSRIVLFSALVLVAAVLILGVYAYFSPSATNRSGAANIESQQFNTSGGGSQASSPVLVPATVDPCASGLRSGSLCDR